jgi:predicted dehydrogenase
MAPGIQGSRNGSVVAIASRSLAKAKQFCERLGINRAYGNYAELLDDADVQAVYIPLPNSLHKEWTIRAAEKGKHVLCEKPFACNAQEAQEMVDACRRQGVIVMEAFPHRFQPQNRLVKELIDEGRIGRVLWMTAVHSGERPAPGDPRLSGELCNTVLMEKGCYCVNTARFIFDLEPVSVYATAEFGEEGGADERVTATLNFPGGGVAQFDCNFRLIEDTYYQSYEVFGERGRIYVPKGLTQLETYRQGKIVDASLYVSDNSGTERIDIAGVHQWQLEAEYFSGRVLKGEDIEYPHENGLANMRVIDAIYASAREGRVVKL